MNNQYARTISRHLTRRSVLARYRAWWLLGLLLLSFDSAAEVRVGVSIKPLHSLVAAIMEGVSNPPDLIIQGHQSPHTSRLKPSQARKLAEAQLLVWVGAQLESHLGKALPILSTNAEIIELSKIKELHWLPKRRQMLFADDAHHATHDADLDHAVHPVVARDKTPIWDPHIWLSIDNAAIIADTVTASLVALSPTDAARYQSNNAVLKRRLAALDQELDSQLQHVRQKPFIVLHDSMRYYGNHFRLLSIGAIMENPEIPPGVARMQQLQSMLEHSKVVCIFTEPQLRSNYITQLVAHTTINVGELEVLGSSIPEGPMLYFKMMRRITNSTIDCLSGRG